MKTLKTKSAVGLVATTAAVALMLSGCARGSESPGPGDGGAAASPGITDTTLTFGITTPLSGASAGVGNCTADGALAYFGQKNAAGGITFGDGKTRTVQIKTYDDQYDPQKAITNFQQMATGGVFAAGIGLGTPTNRAWREAAIQREFPQVLVTTGDQLFSDRDQSPWQLGLIPTYPQEGEAFGNALVASGQPHKVAILSQNDDYGKGYVEGLKKAIADHPDIQIVGELTYETTDTSVDAQLTELAGTGADVFFNAMSITPLVISSLQKAQQLNWKPSWFLPANTSSAKAILEPGGGAAFPGIYTVAFAEAAGSPAFQNSDAGKAFMAGLAEYTDQDGIPAFPQCVWSWIAAETLTQAFEHMKQPTRESFMAALRDISDFHASFMLPGAAIDTTKDGVPAVSQVVVQKYNGTGYDTVQAFG
ncbi:ABC transporter substrate-binding protein [Microbacterium sp.]|uniref:ABC transporter substrate-binding protein n=1 Tax=Microbacterium sp. TaxID=51671 RepID=UPI003A9120CF